MEQQITVNDTLEEIVESAIEEVKDLLYTYLKENPDSYEVPDISDLGYSGEIHEIIDSSVPIYSREIDTAWYLHSNDLKQAYENAGVGDNPIENDGMSAIYFYIQDAVYKWYGENAEEIFEDWELEKDEEECNLDC